MNNKPNWAIGLSMAGGVALSYLVVCSVTLFAQASRIEPESRAPVGIRIWGADDRINGASPLLAVLTKLEDAFILLHPEVHFSNQLHGNDSALGALYVEAADLVFMTRPPSYFEVDGYQQAIQGQTPLQVPIMRGGTSASSAIPPLVIVVNSASPLKSITLAQVKTVFLGAHCCGAKTWRVLGVGGTLGQRRMQLFGFDTESDEAAVFREVVLGDSARWTCNYVALPRGEDAARRIAQEVQRNPSAIGLTTLDAVTSGVHALGIVDASGKPVMPTAETLASDDYPLGRTVVAATRREREGISQSAVSDFLGFLKGPEARNIISSDQRFIQLSAASSADASEVQR